MGVSVVSLVRQVYRKLHKKDVTGDSEKKKVRDMSHVFFFLFVF